ncbi:hypothetical protein ACFS7Z_03430 [Pontibacter toksunensis]|uniref:Uncharacterized protein n=1 Tax=Pontibacter toksunensis TaxID=1332631 RepID=A0ABW6BP98_9BACT
MNRKFAGDLIVIRLQKVARVGAPNPEKKNMAKEIAGEYLSKSNGQIVFREFQDATAAMEW